jgi:glycosyltransferase involved in cell wall biosynthesis
MKFSIITPTYKRPEELKRCIESVLLQNHKNWEIIIVNDSPAFNYEEVELFLEKQKAIKYFKNSENTGVNFSRNFAIGKISADSDYIIFLDDDDWLASDALSEINIFLENYQKDNDKKLNWLITNLTFENGNKITKSHINEGFFSYFWDSLLFKRFTGDPTHTISIQKLKQTKFSEKIKNGEEWMFFAKIKSKAYYKNINTKITNGYSETGLTKNFKKTYFKNTFKIFFEISNLKMFVYLIFRLVNSIKLFFKMI